MTKFLLSVFVTAVALFVSQNAIAGAGECMDVQDTCTVTVSTDSGTAKICADGANACTCEAMYWCTDTYTTWPGYNCGGGYATGGTLMNGGKCCVAEMIFCGAKASDVEKVEMTSENGDLSKVFGVAPGTTEVHWGWVNGNLRSSNVGRATSAGARLDICLGYADVDFITSLASDNASRYSYCAGSTYGCGTGTRNEYCTNVSGNGLTVCQDRCACYYGQSECQNL